MEGVLLFLGIPMAIAKILTEYIQGIFVYVPKLVEIGSNSQNKIIQRSVNMVMICKNLQYEDFINAIQNKDPPPPTHPPIPRCIYTLKICTRVSSEPGVLLFV